MSKKWWTHCIFMTICVPTRHNYCKYYITFQFHSSTPEFGRQDIHLGIAAATSLLDAGADADATRHAHARTHAYTHAYTHALMHARMHASSTHARTHTYTNTAHPPARKYTHARWQSNKRTQMVSNKHACTHTGKNTITYVYTHARKPKCISITSVKSNYISFPVLLPLKFISSIFYYFVFKEKKSGCKTSDGLHLFLSSRLNSSPFNSFYSFWLGSLSRQRP